MLFFQKKFFHFFEKSSSNSKHFPEQMKLFFLHTLLWFSSQLHYGSGQTPNPESFQGYNLLSYRVDQDGLAPDPPDTCGLTCRGANHYPLGLLACLRNAFEVDRKMPRVNISEALDQDLPKVVFGPSLIINDYEFNIREYNIARTGSKSRWVLMRM